jgi:small conductance mechanosensitive channel
MGVELVFNGRAGFTLNAMLMVFIGLLIITLVESRMKIEKIPERPAEESEEQVSNLVYMVVKDDTTESVSPFALNRNLKRKWPYMKAEEKLEVIISRVLLSIAVISTIILIFREEIFGRDSIITYIQSGNWPRGVNIFSVSAILFMAIMAIVAVTIIKGILNLLAKALTARAETMCHLIRSCLEYTITIAVVYIAMGYLGVDIRALSATVGFLSLIIGFGAKSLITDIVAGLFIIFEGEFQVGDIVEIAGYRGMVKEIGLRTTKLISWDKNIKIINNHDIHNVINMTMRNSFASVSFTVPVTTSIEEVEQVFKEELPKLKQKYPQIIGDPYFAGILSFAGSKMKCRNSAEVKELERGEMESQLHREVQEIMQRHNIPMK